MLFPTQFQPLVILMTFLAGIVAGLLFDGAKILTTLVGMQKFSRHFFDFLAGIFSSALLLLVNLKFNYGQFRLYVIAIFLATLLIERLLSKFLWTKLLEKWYTQIAKASNAFIAKVRNGRKKKEKIK